MGSGRDEAWDGVGDDLLPVDPLDDELELVGATLRRTLVQPLPSDVAEAHVRLMVAAHVSGGSGPRRVLRRAPRPAGASGQWQRRLVPLVSGVAAAGLAAAAVTGAFPTPLQSRLADAAAHLGVSLPGRDDHRNTRVSTPLPTEPTPTTQAPPTTVATGQTATTQPPPVESTVTTPTTIAPAPPLTGAPSPTLATPTTAPPTTARETPTTTAPLTSTTSTTKAPDTCVNPVLISVTATLEAGGKVVDVVIRTSGTVPYMSATIDGMGGVVEDLQRTSFGFQGTLTAPTTVPAGSTVVVGSCGNQIRGSAPVQG